MNKGVMRGSLYQELASRTLISGPHDVGLELTDKQIMIIWNAIGVAGEAGEICDYVKKSIFHQHVDFYTADGERGFKLFQDKMKEELGDLMWYIAGLCTKLGLDLEDVMIDNVIKLMKRYPDGYSSEDSLNRELRQEGGKEYAPGAQREESSEAQSWKD